MLGHRPPPSAIGCECIGASPESSAVANARLIAAVPELYDACRLAVVSMQEALDGSPSWMSNMRADLAFIEKAIAHATVCA